MAKTSSEQDKKSKKDEKKDKSSVSKDDKKSKKGSKSDESKKQEKIDKKAQEKADKKAKKESKKDKKSKNMNEPSNNETTVKEEFQFYPSRFVMPRGKKGYVFAASPGPARYPVTNITSPIMRATRQKDLVKKMISGPSSPAYTLGVRHSDIRCYYNKIE